MIKFLLLFFGLFFSLFSLSQNTFCDGWNDGYKAGKIYNNETVYITPICPTSGIGENTYEIGYQRGFEKATGKQGVVAIPTNDSTEKTFCDGWEKGYTVAMNNNDESVFIIPICPITDISSDTYEDGYLLGYQEAMKDLDKTSESKPIIVNDDDDTFCDGWEKGYQIGLSEWAIENDKSKPLRITPICPIPRINEDTYQHGFELGRTRAKSDME